LVFGRRKSDCWRESVGSRYIDKLISEARRKRRMKKSLITALAIVLALGVIGVGYAAWAGNIPVTGEVLTGTVSVDRAGTSGWKSNGGSNVKFTEKWTGPNKGYILSFENVYPGWQGEVNVYWKNTGSLPIDFNPVIADVPGGLTVTTENAPYHTSSLNIEPGKSWGFKVKVRAGDSIAQDTRYEFLVNVGYSQAASLTP